MHEALEHGLLLCPKHSRVASHVISDGLYGNDAPCLSSRASLPVTTTSAHPFDNDHDHQHHDNDHQHQHHDLIRTRGMRTDRCRALCAGEVRHGERHYVSDNAQHCGTEPLRNIAQRCVPIAHRQVGSCARGPSWEGTSGGIVPYRNELRYN